jgi:hypothetical protein
MKNFIQIERNRFTNISNIADIKFFFEKSGGVKSAVCFFSGGQTVVNVEQEYASKIYGVFKSDDFSFNDGVVETYE